MSKHVIVYFILYFKLSIFLGLTVSLTVWRNTFFRVEIHLHMAIKNCACESAKLLLQCGASFEAKANRFFLFSNYKNNIIKNKSDKTIIRNLRIAARHR
jgi:hypothetical protein